tara:strand:- start:4528 stop:5697 length:1170 start_codon:yes stop_codon:yes gene_type:complete
MGYNALYLGYNSTYVNQQKNIILSVLKATTNLTIYGPGYNSKKELEMGINSWSNKHQKFEILVLDPGILSHDENTLSKKYYKEYFRRQVNDYLHFNSDEIVDYGKSYKDFFQSFKGKKFTFVTWDPYDTPRSLIEDLKTSDTFVIDIFGEQLNSPINELKLTESDLNYFKGKISNNWIDFERDYRHKIISFPHAIYESQFVDIPLKDRKINFSIIGVLYPERKDVIKHLSFAVKLSLILKIIFEYFILKFFKKATFKNIKKRIFDYQNLIEKSRFCFVSGSKLRYPVRKYFEVPSKGTIPIGWRCNGFTNLGFKDGENFLVAENSETVSKYLSLNNSEKLNQIAKNAQQLIFQKHSYYARIKQFSESLKLIMEGKFSGSYWEEGLYKHY